MKKKGNRRYERITISFTDGDRDIVRYIKDLKRSNKASQFIRDAIREKMQNTSSDENYEVENRLKTLDRRVNILEEVIISNSIKGLETRRSSVTTDNTKLGNNSEKESGESIDKDTQDALNNALNHFEL